MLNLPFASQKHQHASCSWQKTRGKEGAFLFQLVNTQAHFNLWRHHSVQRSGQSRHMDVGYANQAILCVNTYCAYRRSYIVGTDVGIVSTANLSTRATRQCVQYRHLYIQYLTYGTYSMFWWRTFGEPPVDLTDLHGLVQKTEQIENFKSLDLKRVRSKATRKLSCRRRFGRGWCCSMMLDDINNYTVMYGETEQNRIEQNRV